MVLAQKMDMLFNILESRAPIYVSTHLQTPDSRQRCKKHTLEKRQHLQQMQLIKLDVYM